MFLVDAYHHLVNIRQVETTKLFLCLLPRSPSCLPRLLSPLRSRSLVRSRPQLHCGFIFLLRCKLFGDDFEFKMNHITLCSARGRRGRRRPADANFAYDCRKNSLVERSSLLLRFGRLTLFLVDVFMKCSFFFHIPRCFKTT